MSRRILAYDDVAPRACAMIESMRAYGYSLQAALADLVDNSITAGASNVWIQLQWKGKDSWIAIEDDGEGMDEPALRDAMRLGSMNPLAERRVKDLGRFGMGLKSASLSQCRRMTVASRTAEGRETHVRRWDLDFLAQNEAGGWQLLRAPASGSEKRLSIRSLSSGTVVLWEVMDRLTGHADLEDNEARQHFNQQIIQAAEWLQMIFHRYLTPLTPTSKRPRLQIHLQEKSLPPWDPFLESHPATQVFPDDRVKSVHGKVIIKGYILPHKDKLSDELHSLAAGPCGWNAQQGFYVYRNERLLVAGDWLGLGSDRPWSKEEHYKLARIRIDLTNTMDHLWQLDVKKSSVSPPAFIRPILKIKADEIRQQAKAVYSHRGQYGPQKKIDRTRPWKSITRNGRTAYIIDRKHPLVTNILNLSIGMKEHKRIEAMLRIIEETVPVEQIWITTAEQQDGHGRPFDGVSQNALSEIIQFTYEAIKITTKLKHDEITTKLLAMEEFADAKSIIQSLRNQP